MELLNGDNTVLVVLSTENYIENKKEILKELFKKNMGAIYVTINKSYDNIIRMLEKDKIKSDKIFFIDAITKTIASGELNEEKVFFAENPQSLTKIELMTKKAILEVKEGFLFFDSLSTLLVYNNLDIVSKFAHSLINELERSKLKGVFISLKEETDKKLVAQLTQFVDKVVEV